MISAVAAACVVYRVWHEEGVSGIGWCCLFLFLLLVAKCSVHFLLASVVFCCFLLDPGKL